MQQTFEVFKHPTRGFRVVKHGFSWPGFLLTWVWAFAHQLWLAGALLLVPYAALALASVVLFQRDWAVETLLSLVVQLTVGFRGNAWRGKALESRGFEYVCAVNAASGKAALAKLAHVGDDIPAEWRTRLPSTGLSFAPAKSRRLFALAWLTLKAAFRYRVVQILVLLVLAAVVGLPLIIKHDGTAEGFTQILLTYTLGTITALLGLATLWLACGTLARDVEECQMQMVAVKPIARWEVWLGKWIGIMTLNALLLAVSGAAVYGLMQWRAGKLPAEVQKKLRAEILVARGSVREPVDQKRINEDVDRLLKERLKDSKIASMDHKYVRDQLEQRIKAERQVVLPGGARRWILHVGALKSRSDDEPMFIRT